SRKIERFVYGLALQICRMVAVTEPRTIQKAVQISGALTDEAVRNGSIKNEERIQVLGLSVAPVTPTMHPKGLVTPASTGAEEARQDANIVTGTFTLNDHFATTLFDSGADYSFVSTTFIPLLRIKPSEISGALTDEAVRNGSIKKVKKRGNVEKPSKDKSGRDDNKRTRTGNIFATTMNPVGRENTENQARGRAFKLGAEEARQDANIVTGTFTLNDHFATTLFDSGADL
nr:reverse transcriptase domain-containing protein [Tanacetum cinerariifolium]